MSNSPTPLTHLASILALWFYSGKAPKAPGTFGSLATFPLFLIYYFYLPSLIWLGVICVALLVVGTWASNVYMEQNGTHDPGEIVIDEVLGQMMVLGAGFYIWCGYECSLDVSLVLGLLCFILFRLFDIIKPWPIKWFDQHIKGGFGVMFDDILAALFALIPVFICYKVML